MKPPPFVELLCGPRTGGAPRSTEQGLSGEDGERCGAAGVTLRLYPLPWLDPLHVHSSAPDRIQGATT